ncbi:MAG: endonuclease/exonuclease/phosphatase family protein [Alphaproteobacteria bacterium]|nr:endonuclease/exonuclease/phosphatase family protein [Alphaproteobacteria bacterium]MCB9690007.1 endonuclease/exonuclease/phosphatase family protein [Alphaproteobacteria bacterium]
MRTALLTALVACKTAEPEVPTEGTLDLLTYNVQGLPDPLTESDRLNVDRMNAIAPLLDAFDIVGLQEDFDASNHALLTDPASHDVKEWFSAPVDESRAYGAGLALLSRAAEVGYVETHYAQCNGVFDGASDCLASKGFQRLSVQLGAHVVDLINTHHEAGGGPEDDAARRSQVLEVIAAIDANPDHAVIFMGDTNLRPSDPEDVDELALYADAGLRDACVELDCAEPDHIDRFLIRDAPGIALSVDDWRNEDPTFRFPEGDPMSDHPPISITLSWQAE